MSEETTTETAVVVSEGVDKSLELFNAYYVNAQKFYAKGTASAAARARKAASQLTKHFKVVRKELQVAKQAKVAARKDARAAKAATPTE